MTPDEILEKHLSLMLGRTDQSYVSIDEMKKQPEWQATINAMVEYGDKLVEVDDDKLKSQIDQYHEENLIGEFGDQQLERIKEIIKDFVKFYS